MLTIVELMESNWVMTPEGPRNIADVPWNPHSKFRGVSIQNLIVGKDSQGGFSVHLVKVEPHMEIGEHLHHNQTELHQVLSGGGRCLLEGEAMSYSPGSMAVLPADKPHRVVAGGDGLLLQAVFCPPLC